MTLLQDKHQQPFLLRRAIREGTPFVDGETVTFLWHGEKPPMLRGDFNGWSELALPVWQAQAADLWTAELCFPLDAYVEYCFGAGQESFADPFNLRRTPAGGSGQNSFFYMPDAAPSPLLQRQRGIARGQLTRHQLATEGLLVGSKRPFYLYQPPVSQPVPLLLVYDGLAYRRRVKLPLIVDNLIAAGRMAPVALLLLASGGKNGRIPEYACSESTLYFIQQLLLPFAREQLNLLPLNGCYGVLGASLGGVMALFTALRMPHIFGKVLSQSGSFRLNAHEAVTGALVRALPRQPIKIWLDAGCYEALLPANEEMAALLATKAYDVTFSKFNAGHNYAAWANDVAAGLEALFPPQG